MTYRKADVLIVIMGTNPFPNIVSAATRVRTDGYIFCICSEDTAGEPYKKFKKLLEKKGFIDGHVKKYSLTKEEMDVENIVYKIKKSIFNEILRITQGDIIIELNYTCGKKIMSSVAYDVIRNMEFKDVGRDIKINLTYIDAERELMYVEQLGGEKTSVRLCDLEESFELNIVDIIKTYNTKIGEVVEEPRYEVLSNKLGGMFENVSYEEYKKLIEVKENLYGLANDKEKKKNFINELKAYVENSDFPISIEDIESADFNKKDMVEYFRKTEWFEEYIFSKLFSLKKEKIIEGLAANITRKPIDNETQFEVDIVMYKKYKIYAISITTENNVESAEGKLYEIFQRSTDLAGDETKKGYINLCWDVSKLKAKCVNLWDDDLPKDVFIAGVNDLSNLKIKVKNWICGGEKDE